MTRELSIEVEVIADMVVVNPFDFFVEDYATDFPFRYPAQLAGELTPLPANNAKGHFVDRWLGTDRQKPKDNQ